MQRTLDQIRRDRTFILALQQGNHGRAVALLEAGADPNARAQSRDPAPPPAFKSDFFEAVATLFGRGRRQNKGPTALLLAIDDDDAALVSALLARGADVNAADANGNTPLKWAVLFGSPATVSALLARGARVDSPDERGWTPLMLAASRGDVRLARLLLAHGAQVNRQGKDGNTAWKSAGNAAILALLRSAVRVK